MHSLSRNIFVGFCSLLLVLSALQPAFAASLTDITATDAETHGVNGFTMLRPSDVDTFTIGGSTYAIVVSHLDDRVQIIDISNPANIVAKDAETDGVNGFTELDGPYGVDTFTIGASTYAIVTSFLDDGVQIIDISNPANIVATDAETEGVNGFTVLRGSYEVDTFTIGASTYAIVVAWFDGGVQIIDISNPANIVAKDAETDNSNGFSMFHAPSDVVTFTIGASTYAIVTAATDGGVQIIDISNPANIVAKDAETDEVNGFTELLGPHDVDTFTIGASTYAIVTAATDDGVQIMDISNPANIVAKDAETDGVNGFTELDDAFGVDTFTIGGSTYAIVVSNIDDGVQIVDISDPANIVAKDAETDGVNGFTELDGLYNVDTFTIGGSTYAIVVSNIDDGVQIIELNTVSSSSTSEIPHGSGCADCTPPTLGVDHNSKRLVTNGFSYNANPVDVSLYYTPYPLITANIGHNNTAEFKIYENSGPDKIRHFDFAFGLAKGQILSDSKARIEWDKNLDGTEDIKLVDPNNVLQNVTISSDIVLCQDTSNDQCLLLLVFHTFRAPLEFDIVATNVWDEHRNAWQNYYNHGIHITGESLNPPKQYTGIDKGHIYHLTETGKNVAVDEFGNGWTFSNIWIKDYIKNERVQDKDTQVMQRTHSDFANLVNSEINRAQVKLLALCPECSASFSDFTPSTTIIHPERFDNKLDDPEVQKNMVIEAEKAQKIMDALLDLHDRNDGN